MVLIADFLLFICLASDTFENESDLYNAIKLGDREAFRQFYDNHFDSLFIYLRNRNVSKVEAEDLIQKAFLYIWEHRKRIKPDLSLKAYLYRIVYTRMLNQFEKEPSVVEFEKEFCKTTSTPYDFAKYSDLSAAFAESVSKMPERRREVFESCFIKDLTYKETASILSISVKTVENHMALAFKDLRNDLKIFQETYESR